jgi:hypothetical protein
VQFYHNFSKKTMKGTTYAIPDISLESMLKVMLSYASNPQKQYISFGKAVTHPKDQFSRKIGSSVAKAKSELVGVSRVEYTYQNNQCTFLLFLENSTVLLLAGRFDKPNLHLISVED